MVANNFLQLAIEIGTLFLILSILGLRVVVPQEQRVGFGYLQIFGLLGTLLFSLSVHGDAKPVLGGTYFVDGYAMFLKQMFLVGAIFLSLSTLKLVDTFKRSYVEFLLLLLLMVFSMCVLVSASDLITFFVALEAVSMASYFMEGFKSREGIRKHIVLWSLSSAILLYGISLVFGIAGSFRLTDIQAKLTAVMVNHSTPPILLIGTLLLLVGVTMKLLTNPFRAWITTAFMAGFFRVMVLGFRPILPDFKFAIAFIAVSIMLVAGILLIRAQELKRVIAYTTTVQVGFLLTTFLLPVQLGSKTLLLYTVAYGFIITGVAAMLMNYKKKVCDLSSFEGLWEEAPIIGLGLLILLVSVAGVPFLSLFTARLYLLSALATSGFLWLVIFCLLTSLLNVFSFLRIIKIIYTSKNISIQETSELSKESPEQPFELSLPFKIVFYTSVFITLWMGLYPNAIIHYIDRMASIVSLQ